MVTKLLGDDGRSGLNLTCALLGSYLKYTALPSECQLIDEKAESKKAGYFYTEVAEINKVAAVVRDEKGRAASAVVRDGSGR